MTQTLNIALAQLNPMLGDIPGNVAKMRSARADAARRGVHLVVFTELFVTGYPPEDLVRKPAFAAAARAAAEAFAAETADGGPGVLFGTVWPEDGKVLQCGRRRRRGQDPRRPAEGRSAELRRVR